MVSVIFDTVLDIWCILSCLNGHTIISLSCNDLGLFSISVHICVRNPSGNFILCVWGYGSMLQSDRWIQCYRAEFCVHLQCLSHGKTKCQFGHYCSVTSHLIQVFILVLLNVHQIVRKLQILKRILFYDVQVPTLFMKSPLFNLLIAEILF
jgi:hypothetical protein